MMVAIPGVVSDGDETTTARLLGCAGGPLGLMGVTTGLYWLPQPATKATAAYAPAFTKRARVWLKFIEKSLIQFFPAYRLIVNQLAHRFNSTLEPTQTQHNKRVKCHLGN
jgi:hypothetical protein